MAGYGSRANSDTFTSGDTIKAAHLNDEFDQLVAAFHESSGHSHDGSTDGDGAAITSLPANCTVPDNINLIFGTNSDVSVQYDETTTDSLRIAALEGAAVAITFAADEGDDAGDEWKLNIADGGVLTLGNDINSAGTYVTHLTLTPNATVANSTAAFAGNVTVAGDLTISGDDLTMGTNTSGYVLVADGTNFNPVALSGDVTVAANGAVTIANQAVENAMLADDAVGADELAANAVVNASIASGAAIAFSKMADLTTSRALVSDGSGDVSVSSVTSTELGYLDITTLGTSEASKAVTVDSSGDLLVPDSDKFKFGTGSDMQVYHDGTNAYVTNSEGALKIATETSGIAVTIGHSTSVVTVADNLTVTGDLTVNGDTTTVNTATLSVEDPLIIMASGNNSADSVDIGFYGLYDTSGSQDLYAGLFRDASDSGKWKLFKDNQAAPTTTVNTSGTGYAVGTLVADLEGNVTGNASGTAATVTGAAQSNITSLGTLTTLTVDSIIIDGTNIGHTSDTDAMAISSGGVVTFSQVPLFPADTIETADIQADAVTGAKIADDAIDSEHYTDGSVDLAHISTAAKTEVIAIACGDETTATAAATAVVTFHMPYAFYLTGIKAGVTTAPVGSVLTVDLNEAGSTCLTTKLTIDASEKTSATAATAAVIGGAGPALAADALMTIDVDGVGSSTAGAGLKVYLIGYQT